MKVCSLFLLAICISRSYGATSIVGGTPTTIAKHPYMADILVTIRVTANQSYSYLFDSSIISPKYVLTGGHCLQGKVTNISVSVGSTIVEQGTFYYTTQYKVHPQYNDTSLDYDIGLVIMQADMKLDGTTSKAIKLVGEGVKTVPGDSLVVVGWAPRVNNGYPYNSELTEVTVQIVNQQVCAKLYANASEQVYVTPRKFCAGDLMKGGRDTCNGNLGGPAINSAGLQVGIASGGFDCNSAYSPGTYTDIASVRSWVKSVAGL